VGFYLTSDTYQIFPPLHFVIYTTWLLTKVKVEGSLKDGKPSGSFSIEKPSVDPGTLKAMVQGITTLFKG